MYMYAFLNDFQRYQQVFGQVIALEGQEVQIKEKRYVTLLARCATPAPSVHNMILMAVGFASERRKKR